MAFTLVDQEETWSGLFPFTYTRPVAEIRCGILTLREKWELWLGDKATHDTRAYLQDKYGSSKKNTLRIGGNVLPNEQLVKRIMGLRENDSLYLDGLLVASTGTGKNKKVLPAGSATRLLHCWDIFRHNGQEIRNDFVLLTRKRKSATMSKTVNLLGPAKNLFIEKGAVVEACTINTGTGPVYIGAHAEVMEGSMLRGPLAIGENSTVKMGAKIYGDTTIGPHCKVGGEVSNTVFFGYSNKAHDGFVGNSVIGEWCNLGADTNSSNLKNNYATVKVYDMRNRRYVDSGLQFCGLIMGDHSRCGINTMFNTGTVVGVGCNIFDAGFPPTFIPSFSWGGKEGFGNYELDKFFETARLVFERRGRKFDKVEEKILRHVAKQSA
jgi:UDP-N-acetylglucosamine diphosphorylase/glucosamine-1-phosphate N-acetyltransferase